MLATTRSSVKSGISCVLGFLGPLFGDDGVALLGVRPPHFLGLPRSPPGGGTPGADRSGTG